MIRALTSCLWLIAALALGLEAVAEPCQTMAEMQAEVTVEADLHCADMAGMSMGDEMPAEHEFPGHETVPCCCAALLGQVAVLDGTELRVPILLATKWAVPLPEQAASEFPDYEPPPPRV